MQKHITVMLEEAIESLELTPDSVVVDATLGSGGHSALILTKLNTDGMLIALDADPSAVETQKGKLHGSAHLALLAKNFRHIDEALAEVGVPHVDAILADLGWRMEQFDGGGKGFSFQQDEPLTMTFGNADSYSFTARDIVNEWDEEVLINILKGYGEERFARRIARKIVEVRTSSPIETSGQLVSVIMDAVPSFYRTGKVHPATRTFQALRIAVNDELDALREFIEKSVELLEADGRLAIITFHSLEDRIVKHAFRSFKEDGVGMVITKKPITPSPEELSKNPRARSAKLRVFKKHHDTQGDNTRSIQG